LHRVTFITNVKKKTKMKNEKENFDFGLFIRNLPYEKYVDFRRSVIDECKIAPITFLRWKGSKKIPKEIYRNKINEVSINILDKIIF
jgi:hypothetical protein